jgi:hypothetical protein
MRTHRRFHPSIITVLLPYNLKICFSPGESRPEILPSIDVNLHKDTPPFIREYI